MAIELAYAVFLGLAIVAFRFCQPATAVIGVFLGGWIFLPNGHYPPGASQAVFPYWITGLAVPSDMLVTKAWIAPLVALLGSMVFDRARLRTLRWTWFDLPVLLWCLWPLAQAVLGADARPQAWISVLYLFGTWGLPWLLGRLYFGTAAGQVLLIKGLVISALVCLPFSLIEGLFGPSLYGVLYVRTPSDSTAMSVTWATGRSASSSMAISSAFGSR